MVKKLEEKKIWSLSFVTSLIEPIMELTNENLHVRKFSLVRIQICNGQIPYSGKNVANYKEASLYGGWRAGEL